MKDLAKEYALARLQGRRSENEISFSENRIFTEEDIKAAFNAGRKSVVENMPELEWRKVFYEGRSYFAAYPLGFSYKIEFVYNEFQIFCNYNYIATYLSLSEAKQAANEDYKQRIKKALGL